jgi:hypothetical protein
MLPGAAKEGPMEEFVKMRGSRRVKEQLEQVESREGQWSVCRHLKALTTEE